MRKFFPYILISVVILAAIFGPLGARLAHAGWFDIGDIASTAIKKVVAWIGYLILMLISQILALAGALLNFSITYSIVDFADTSKAIVETGWTICRDIANLFFIFILLYISIATILQLSGYGMKELLVKVIIIALLVNFSLMITGVIIDGSNILALEFYNKINVTDKATGKKISPSEAITSVFRPQSLFSIDDKPGCLAELDPKTKKCPPGKEDPNPPKILEDGDAKGEVTLLNIFIITIMGSIFFLVLAFVFFAAAVLFVLRTVILWLLMILSPLAFLAMVLPATKSYASQWWKKLFDQAFFAPVYLFLLYLVISIVTSDAIIKDTKKKNLSSAFLDPSSNIDLILQFVTMILLSLAALIIAKQMGAMGSSTVMGWGQKMKGAAQGWAGKMPGRLARRAIAPAAEAFATGEGKGRITRAFARMGEGMRGIPLVGGMATRGAARVGAATRERIGEVQKKYEKYTSKELKNMIPTMMPFNRAAIIQELAKRGEMKTESGLDEKEIKRSRKIMQRYGMDTRPLDRLRPDVIEDKEQRDKALKKANWVDMDKETIETIMDDADMRKVVIENAGPSVARKIYEETELETQEKFFKSLTDLDKAAKGFEDIAKALEKLGNHSMASWVRGPIGSKVIDSHLGVEPEKKEKGPEFETFEPGTKTFR